MTKRNKAIDDNNHLVLHFEFQTAKLATNFAVKKDDPRLTKLYNLLSLYGAEARPLASMWNHESKGTGLDQMRQLLTTGKHAARLRRQVTVVLPHDGNLKMLMINFRNTPEFADIIKPKSLNIGLGSYMTYVGYIDPQTKALVEPEKPEFIPPAFPPQKQGFEIR